MKHTFYFVLPQDRHLPSGGNIYNQKLTEALQAAGHSIHTISFEAYRRALQQDQPGYYWVDSLFIRHIADLPRRGTATGRPRHTRSFFIFHHLESLSPPPGISSHEVFHRDEEKALSFFDGFLATSAFAEKYLRERGFRQPVLVVEPGIDPLPPCSPAQGDTVRALMVANLIERKGVLEWLTHLGASAAPSYPFRLTIIGREDLEPAYAQACRQIIDTHPVLQKKVCLTGSLPHAEVLRHYAQSDVFISAARMETYGMALQEAKACGLPLLALAGGYAGAHIEPGVNGYIFQTIAKMTEFFIALVRQQKLSEWQQLHRQLPAYNTWQQAAASFVRQLHTHKEIIGNRP